MIALNYILNPRHPRFLWVECLASGELAELRAALLTAFERSEQRPFRPHVTLARIHERGGRIARKHPIDRDLVLSQRITSVEIDAIAAAGCHRLHRARVCAATGQN